ncbi:MAG: hypothetical protein J6Z31_06300 [Fibrobacter sp.]|nr:hypothetical protein [Fibrobacter sp.]
MHTTSNTLFSSTPESTRIVRTPFEFDKVQGKAREALSAEMDAVHTEEVFESSAHHTAKLRPLAAFAVFIATIGTKH